VLPLPKDLDKQVDRAIEEDLGDGDLTAALIPADRQAQGYILTREAAVLCGTPWAEAVFSRIDPQIRVEWLAREGQQLAADTRFARLYGPARSLLTAERTALNFLQTLSATATETARYVALVAGSNTRILDTRKTLPGLRTAQKYAVRCGGGHNHRVGLFDGILIKENHIAACGGIGAAVAEARRHHPGVAVEVEVEDLSELDAALTAGADILMLDNFDLPGLREAVKINAGRAKLEASGGLTEEALRGVADTGVDFISVGALTKHIRAIDLSMRLDP